MTNEEKEMIEGIVDDGGFVYAFLHYSDFEEIHDEKFHQLRKAFIKATEELASYCGV